MLGQHQNKRRTEKTLGKLLASKSLVVNTTQDINTRPDNQHKHIKTGTQWGKHGRQDTHCCHKKLQYPYAAK